METTATATRRGRPKSKAPMEQLNVLLPVPIKKRIKKIAFDRGLSAGRFVEHLLKNYDDADQFPRPKSPNNEQSVPDIEQKAASR